MQQVIIIKASVFKDDGTLYIILNVIFQVFLLFFLRQDPGDKGIVPYLLPKRFQPYFWLS